MDDARLRQLYVDSAFSIYPSLEEGFGLPVSESLWHRRPCLCSGFGALGELSVGGGCLTVDTSDWRQLRQGLDLLINDLHLRQYLQHQIAQRRPRLWRDVALEWWHIICYTYIITISFWIARCIHDGRYLH